MRIQTVSILAGSEVCNARCPFCISKMTPPLGLELKEPEDDEAFEWTEEHHLRPEELQDIRTYLESHGTLLMTLIHGASIYDVEGQNVCLTDSLTLTAKTDDLRQLIFFPDGHLRYDWQYPGAILL